MLASTRPNQGKRERRGIVLVLILGMLALMALIGITFATFSGQSRISARNFAQSVNQPQRDELFDYALSQLIMDTADIRSSIRGHSLARDMYGNDANFNGYLAARPDGAARAPNSNSLFYITNTQVVAATATTPQLYDFLTNIPIPANDPTFFGYNFTRWIMRVSYVGLVNAGNGKAVDQTFEVLYDNMTQGDTTTAFSNQGYHVLRVSPIDMPLTPSTPTTLNNPTLGTVTSQAMVQYANPGTFAAYSNLINYPFVLDGRWLHAFNGPGMTNNAVHANFRYNGQNPNQTGMDEDYDAADLENWFLAMQSADGSVIIPSFHRPAAIRVDTVNGYNDWITPPASTAPTWADSASRILRPRQYDGHDSTTFPDLLPDGTGRITYDVDNDGDGVTDSVWIDLGYPARRNAQGQLFKPLFAFMVIGLNGRIPLNTAGNLAGNGSTHAKHLGNSVSEIDPTYGLQNAFDVTTNDPVNAFAPPAYPAAIAQANTQVDSGGTDVRLTQLRNLLAGTRPQQNPQPLSPSQFPWNTDPMGSTNGDNNFVLINDGNQYYFMPNGVAETGSGDIPISTAPLQVQRLTTPVPGRWGEAQAVPGYPIPTPNGSVVNLVGPAYNDHVRAGYSWDPGDLVNGLPRDAADDNFNSFDPYPPGHTGEVAVPPGVGDADYYDTAGALLLPVERMRRYVTPADINGTGRVVQWNGATPAVGPDLGGDQWGRVEFGSYFRPPGLPGQVAPGDPALTGTGVISFQWTTTPATPPLYPTDLISNVPTTPPNNSHNNNPLHGFESFRYPNVPYSTVTPPPPVFTPQRVGGVPFDLPVPPTPPPPIPAIPSTLPTYDYHVNASVNSDGLNEADEINLYQPNPQLDAPFGPSDLQWLYRQQDVDGASLTSRLASLAPISFTNTVDGLRRRRLFAIDSWELNNLVWSNDDPPPAPPATIAPFAYNSRFTQNADAGFTTLNVPAATNTNIAGLNNPTYGVPSPTMSVAHRDKKINLNYPLPVSNDPNELIRQKWISETYQVLKAILPPRSVDTPEELAQLSQFVINIVDFRDPDATITHWVNPDVSMAVWNGTGPALAPTLILNTATAPTNTVAIPLDQYGVEFNPIAINEVLAYSFARKYNTAMTATPRFFIELVNTLTSPATQTSPTSNASMLDLSGFESAGAANPWAGSCWDIVFAEDTPASRPDPFSGQLQPQPTGTVGLRGLIPLTQASFVGATNDLVMNPLPPTPGTTGANFFGTNYFMVIGNNIADFATDGGLPTETGTPALTFTLNTPYDPVDYTSTPPAGSVVPAGALPPPVGTVTPPATYPYPPHFDASVPKPEGTGNAKFYWVCLRRPADSFAPVSLKNPMIVVDSMRFPYIEAKGTGVPGSTDTVTQGTNQLYSYQRLQPYRGGQAVPAASGTGIDPRYGYTEQVAAPLTQSATQGKFGNAVKSITINPIYHTLGFPNDGAFLTPTTTPVQQEEWDYFAFNDRDFTSVFELTLVPGCPPGLFTKQFAEFAPSQTNATTYFTPATTANHATPSVTNLPAVGGTNPGTATDVFANASTVANPVQPHTFPYLVDKFFYTGAGATAAPAPYVGDQTGDGWSKMFEFFEVPSQMIGAIGPVMQGTNFDWMRQDTKPGLINLNLIIDEEVFFSVFGKQDAFFNQQLMNFYQLPTPVWQGSSWGYTGSATPLPLATGSPPVPIVVTSTMANGAPGSAYPMNNVGVVAPDPSLTVPGPVYTYGNRMKASFAQFLSLRHGGSGFVFGYGSGNTGQNYSIYPPLPAPTAALPNPPWIPADRPFHSLSYPDIDYTVLRPAALPPSTYTDPVLQNTAAANYAGDPGVKNPFLYAGYASGTAPSSPLPAPAPAGTLFLPTAIPARRLFQIPDFYPGTTPGNYSNANETGDPYLNQLTPTAVATNPAIGALPPFNVGGTPVNANNSVVNLFWPGNNTPAPAKNPYLGVGTGVTGIAGIDDRQHPYFRSEMLQKAVNLTTVRTHQYAVWITIGFFEVKRQGDLLMMNTNTPWLAFDIMGPEIGGSTGDTTRFRSFFVVDRLKITAYDPNVVGSFRPAVVYRQTIE